MAATADPNRDRAHREVRAVTDSPPSPRGRRHMCSRIQNAKSRCGHGKWRGEPAGHFRLGIPHIDMEVLASKVAILVLADTETHGDLGRVLNAMVATKEFQQSGDELRLVFDGAGTKWPGVLADPGHKSHGLFEQVRDAISGACGYCARAFEEGREENQGYDAFVPLIDSGVSLYVWTGARFLSVVTFTCKRFDVDRAIDVTRSFFVMKRLAHLQF